jgi:guanosine-3',5'-bis(diphosphate) 3'-pyrophosphohydrolase
MVVSHLDNTNREENAPMPQAISLLQLVAKNNPNADLILIEKAIIFATNAHKGQFRKSGEEYVTHPIAVAEILAEQKFDTFSIITALLHDTIEDTSVTKEQIADIFSKEVANLVEGVTKLKKIDYQPSHIRQAENFRKSLVAMSKDLRVLVVKLADRIHNMQTLSGFKNKEKHLKIANETLEIYAPLAERMGMHQFKNELEDLAFKVINPETRNSVKNRLSFLKIKDAFLINHVQNSLSELIKINGLHSNVIGRVKTPYSIWRKMEKKKVSFDQLSDIIAFRIIVPTIQDCYKALGIIHTTYKIMQNEFKDYISVPKANGYKSLHTLVIGEQQQRIEIQIRTYEMDEMARLGLAAHWIYKSELKIADGKNSQFKWMNEIIDMLQHTSNPEEILENTRLDLYSDQVFCFTPKGELISLPNGSTVIDFAFAMHSKIGFITVGAKINGRPANLDHVLQNGDQVEIITKEDSMPLPAWENFAVTGKARAAIKKFIKTTRQSELINLGRAVLIRALQKTIKPYNELDLLPLLEKFQKKNIEDLLFSIGIGNTNKIQVLQSILGQDAKSYDNQKTKILNLINSPTKYNKTKKSDRISIRGLIPGMSSTFAHCCNPLPGDEIIGIIHPGQGIVIHIIGCGTLKKYTDHPERWISLDLEDNGKGIYIAKIRMLVLDNPGSLAIIAACIAKLNHNITNIKIINKKLDLAEVILDLEVSGTNQLNLIITDLKKLKISHEIERFTTQGNHHLLK